jgi:energy-coupling factor transporter ATP-binding protein EcfA2
LEKKIRNDFETQIKSLLDELIPEVVALRQNDLGKVSAIISRMERQYDGLLRTNDGAISGNEAVFKWLHTQASALGNLAEEQVLSGYFGKIKGLVQSWSQTQNLFELYPQHQRCFASHPDDSLWISAVKLVKRTGFKIHTSAWIVTQKLRKLFGLGITQEPVWTHTVSWGVVAAILKNHFLATIIDWIQEDLRLRRELVLVLVAINDMQGMSYVGSKEAQQITETIRKVARLIQTRTTDMADQMRLELYENFQEILPKVYHYDTWSADRNYFDTKKISAQYNEYRNSFGDKLRQWDADLNTRLSQLRIDIGFYRFSKRIQMESQALTSKMTAPFRSELLQNVQKIREELVQTADRFDTERLNKLSRASLVKKINDSSVSLLTHIKLNFFERFSNAIDTLSFAQELDQAKAQILIHNHLLASDTPVFTKPVNPVPEYPVLGVETVDFRHEMTIYLNHELFRELASLPPLFDQRLGKLRMLAAEIIQVVEVNMDVAEDLSNDDPETSLDEIYSLVHDGLDRAAGKAGDLISALTEYVTHAETVISRPVSEFLELCFRIMREDDYLYIRTRNREVRIRSTALDWRARLVKRFDQTRHEGKLRLRQAAIIITRSYQNLLHFFGFQNPTETSQILKKEASEFLSNIDNRLSTLPLIYRKLFSSEPLEDPRFYRGRSKITELFSASLSSWLDGKGVNFAVIGEKGSGKTTALNQLSRVIPENTKILTGAVQHSICTERELLNFFGELFGFSKVASIEDFLAQIHEMEKHPVVILEGFQNLYLRYVDGFEAIETFLVIMTSTAKKCFWVISGSRYGWELMSKIYQVESYFTHVSMVDVVHSATIKEIIMARHAVSGYNLRFEPGDKLILNRAFRRLRNNDEEQQKMISEEYFTALDQVCQGNIAIALLYWQMSIKKTDLETVYIAAVDELVTQLGDGFTNDDLFTLGALLQHDDLTVPQLALVLNKDVKYSQMIVSRLVSRTILLDREGRFTINYLLYRPIAELLKSKNIIH